MAKEEFTSNPKNVTEWNRMWESGKYDPLHDPNVSRYITDNYDALTDGKSNLKIFFPLCGKDVGMKWLADKGHVIIGVEGSEHAVRGFFADQGITYNVTECQSVKGKVFISSDERIKIYCCDFFSFNSSIESQFDAVWDRGAFGALQPVDRQKYADVVLKEGFLKPECRYFIETFEGDPDEGLVSEGLLKEMFNIGKRFSMRRLVYEKEQDSSTDEWVMMVQVHLLQVHGNYLTGQQDMVSTDNTIDSWVEFWEGDNYKMFNSDSLRKFEKKYYDQVVDGMDSIKILFPFCGHDIHMKWYADKGHVVVGVECARKAIIKFFETHKVEFTETECETINGFVFTSSNGKIRLYCGDFFKFNSTIERDFDAVWDRGSFNAVNVKEREKYAAVMLAENMMKPNSRYFLEYFIGPKEEGYVTEDVIREVFKIDSKLSLTLLEDDVYGNEASESTDPSDEGAGDMRVNLLLLRPIS